MINFSVPAHVIQNPIVRLDSVYNIINANKLAATLFQCALSDLIGKNFLCLCKKMHIEDLPLQDNRFDLDQEFPQKFETSIRCPNNVTKIISWDISIEKDGSEKTVTYILIGTDISAFKKLENQKKEVENYLHNVTRNYPGHLYWKDMKSVYLGCNAGFARAAGLNSSEEIVGKTDYDLEWAKDEAEKYRKDDEIVIAGKPKYNFEETQLQAGGKHAYVLATKVPMYDNKKNIIGVMGIYSDITERKQMEEQLKIAKETAEAANEAKSQFLAMISHELRTPLNGILGMAEILTRTSLVDEQKKHVEDITTSGKTLLALVNDVLDFAKLELGKFNLSISSVSLNKLIHNVIKNTQHQVEGKAIELQAFYADDLPHRVIGDELRIMHVLINLVSNAIKYTKKGHIFIRVDLISASEDKAHIQISVEDTGIGIPKDKLDQVFERFTQLEVKDYKRKYRGIGLGLSICQQLIELMGGNITVSSQVGKGSTFQFTIPFPLPQESATSSGEDVQNELADVQPTHFNYHILIVEDELINQTIISMMLKELGCTFQLAKDGKEALEHFNKNTYDFILMDIQLPDMNGMEITKQIRADELKNGTRQIPIIAHTAHVFPEEHQKFLDSGMNGVVTKPISGEKLTAVLKQYGRASGVDALASET